MDKAKKTLVIDSAIVGAIFGAAIGYYRDYNIIKSVAFSALTFATISYFIKFK